MFDPLLKFETLSLGETYVLVNILSRILSVRLETDFRYLLLDYIELLMYFL